MGKRVEEEYAALNAREEARPARVRLVRHWVEKERWEVRLSWSDGTEDFGPILDADGVKALLRSIAAEAAEVWDEVEREGL